MSRFDCFRIQLEHRQAFCASVQHQPVTFLYPCVYLFLLDISLYWKHERLCRIGNLPGTGRSDDAEEPPLGKVE
jgi:hypothetical protein